jgi:hypothetical protein
MSGFYHYVFTQIFVSNQQFWLFETTNVMFCPGWLSTCSSYLIGLGQIDKGQDKCLMI